MLNSFIKNHDRKQIANEKKKLKMECTLILCQVKTPKKHNKILIESHWTSIGSEILMEFRKHTAQKYPPFKEKHLTNFNKIKT